jgi:hypothetical protein
MASQINYGIVNPAVLDYAGQEQKNLNVQKTKMDVERLENERKIMFDFQKQLAAKGVDTDLNFVFDTMIKTGNPDYVAKGLEGKSKLQEQMNYAKIMGYDMTPPAAAPAAAPAAGSPMGMPSAAPAPGTQPVNALVPMAGTQPAPAAPVNALAGAQTAPDQAAVIQNRINGLLRLGTPQALSTAKVLQTQLTALEPTPAIREFNYGQKNPEFTNYQLKKAAAGAARSVVNLPPQEKAEQTERGKFLVEDYKTVTNAARVAARTLPAIETNLDLLDQGFKTGFSAEVQKGAANILGALGVENANKFATDAQIFQAKANETVLQRQLEQKGPQTESDAKRITQTGAQLTNTAEANKFILDVAKAQLKRDIEQRNFYDSWFTKNKTYDGAENAWYTGDGGKSLFTRPELKKYNVQTGASPQRQGNQQTTGGLSPAEQAELDSLRKQFNPAKK